MHTQQANILIKKLLVLYQNTLLLHAWYTSKIIGVETEYILMIIVVPA